MKTNDIPPGTRSPFTNSIIAAFVGTKPGTVVTDAQITKAAGVGRERWQSLMVTVRNVLLKEHSISIRREKNVGYRHQQDIEVPAASEAVIGRIRRMSRRAANDLVYGVKNYAAMPPKAQVEYNTRLAQVGTINHLSTASTERAIRGHVEVTNSKLEVGNTIAMLAAKG